MKELSKQHSSFFVISSLLTCCLAHAQNKERPIDDSQVVFGNSGEGYLRRGTVAALPVERSNTYTTIPSAILLLLLLAIILTLTLLKLLTRRIRKQTKNEFYEEVPYRIDLHVDNYDFSFNTNESLFTDRKAWSTKNEPASWLTHFTKDWMKYLEDSLKLSDISIPGTHDTGSKYGGYGGMFVVCQSWSTRDQLDAGIRYFDIRCRREGDKFTIYHGPVCQHIDFDDVLSAIQSFLNSYPSETLLMRIKEEYEPTKDSKSFELIWQKYMNEMGYCEIMARNIGCTIPSLGSIRGKVVILRDDVCLDPSFGIEYNRSGNPFMEVQDYYSIHAVHGISKKKELIKEFIQKAKRGCGKLVINHCSGTWIPVYSPVGVAKRINKAAYDEIRCLAIPSKQGCVGIIVTDFPSEELIHKIISTNNLGWNER